MGITERKLDLIFCWHMHQPDYRNYQTGEFELPWTYLHAIKDYTDMVYHLEQFPGARAVFNFVPILLDQLESYVTAFATNRITDPLLQLLVQKDLNTLSNEQRAFIFSSCFRCNHATMIQPFPQYKHLLDVYQMLEEQGESSMAYLSGQYLSDLLVWYHLAWTGESVRREHELVINLMSKGMHFSYADRLALFNLTGSLITGLMPRYSALLDAGRIEISSTPHYHPIGPLLIDFQAARESNPNSSLPESPDYPGGRNRVKYHIDSAIASHETRFGQKPNGFWPAEGGVSDAFVGLLGQSNCKWSASGEGVLVNSLFKSNPERLPDKRQTLYRPYRIDKLEGGVNLFFRDDYLSDLIGFEYAKWHGRDAASNFILELEKILQTAPEHENPVVSVILDGENAWEYYPYNGFYFLSDLYEALQSHPSIRMTTFNDYIDRRAQAEKEQTQDSPSIFAEVGVLQGLVAGSWVYGNFSTWIGCQDKNRAWDLLCAAKRSFDHVTASGRLNEDQIAAASRQLASCESSDWCWWFGDYNPRLSVESFDKLYRENLSNLYRLLQLPVPGLLSQPVSHGGHDATVTGAMRRAN